MKQKPKVSDFLRAVLPADERYCVAIPSGKGFKQKTVNSIQEICQFAKQNYKMADVYFGVGTVKEPFVINPKTGKKSIRIAQNIKSFKSFIMDMDVGEDKDYATTKDAWNDVKRLTHELKLPTPTMVKSGSGGLHVYFTLTESIPADKWKFVAEHFKKVLKGMMVHADPSRTADVSSVLRVPYTLNHKKRQKKLVELVHLGQPIKPKDFARIILTAAQKYGKIGKVAKISSAFDQVESNIYKQRVYIDAQELYDICPQMRFLREVGGNVSEPYWKGGLQTIRFVEDWKTESVLISNGDPRFSKDEMMFKISYMDERNVGAATCNYFNENNPGVCDSCENRHPTKGPYSAVLDNKKKINREEPESAKKHEEEFFSSSKIEPIVEPPNGYVLQENGVYMIGKDEEGEPQNECILDVPLFLSNITRDNNDHHQYFFTGIRKTGEIVEDVLFPPNSLSDDKAFVNHMLKYGFPVSEYTKKKARIYMLRYIEKINQIKVQKSYSRMGWSDDEENFVIGTTVLTPNGQEKIPFPSQNKETKKFMLKAGNLEDWKKVIDVYAQDGYEPYAFAHLIAYGAPLMQFTDYHGTIFNLVGDSGSGKSTLLRSINSVWGHPEKMLLIHADTTLSKMHRIGVMNSLPITYDEVTNIEPRSLSDFAYTFTQGRDRNRLNSDSEEKENNSSWKTLLCMSSNSNLMEKLSMTKGNAEAESLRIFEYYVQSHGHILSKKEADKVFPLLKDNYGHAGEIYADYLVQNREEVKQLFHKVQQQLDEEFNFTTKERYWSAAVATCLTGGIIAKKLGLIKFNMKKIVAFAKECVEGMRETVGMNIKSSVAILAEYMDSTIGNSVFFNGTDRRTFHLSSARNQIPQDLFNRVEVENRVAYISVHKFREFVNAQSVDFRQVRRELSSLGIMKKYGYETKKRLLADSGLETSGQTRCYVIDLGNPEFSGDMYLVKPFYVDKVFMGEEAKEKSL